MMRRRAKCPAEITLSVIGGRWKVPILYHLFQGVKRFSELQRSVSGVTQKVLTQQLREMERDRILHREVYAQVPPKVEYSLTDLGKSLKPVIDAMCEWGGVFATGKQPPDSVGFSLPPTPLPRKAPEKEFRQ
ncbi:MAG: helix-turn-helix transcriptional regulator [Acidobacteriia bacterium]|nr:helix-turn-helix transcriptional regulator [Terriglobia bacterium]